MTFSQDLIGAYFARIGYIGSDKPTLETLNGIALAHVQSIPFENLDILLGKTPALDQESLVNKLIYQRRGGYCFEQNGLLLLVLATLGFQVTPLSARVRWQQPRDFIPPRTHLFIRVELEGESWLADVGVGSLSPTSAIRLDIEGEQATLHEPRRIIREGNRYFHQIRFDSDWHDVCEFTGEEMPLIDRELANWFTSAHPQSHFKNRLSVARATENGRITLFNRELTSRKLNNETKKRLINSNKELLTVLDEYFGLSFPPDTVFQCSGLNWLA